MIACEAFRSQWEYLGVGWGGQGMRGHQSGFAQALQRTKLSAGRRGGRFVVLIFQHVVIDSVGMLIFQQEI